MKPAITPDACNVLQERSRIGLVAKRVSMSASDGLQGITKGDSPFSQVSSRQGGAGHDGELLLQLEHRVVAQTDEPTGERRVMVRFCAGCTTGGALYAGAGMRAIARFGVIARCKLLIFLDVTLLARPVARLQRIENPLCRRLIPSQAANPRPAVLSWAFFNESDAPAGLAVGAQTVSRRFGLFTAFDLQC